MSRTDAHTLPPERKIAPVLRAFERSYGVPRNRRRDPLEVLVLGILSQNTTDLNSGRAYEELLGTFGSWDKVASASRSAVARAIREGGLAAQKAATIKAVMRRLRREGAYSLEFLRGASAGEIEGELTAVKGVGVKTARLVVLFGFGRPVFVVDTHVHRVTRRLGLISERCTREKAHVLLDELVPDPKKYSGHMNIIRHGRQVCHARSPVCEGCVARRWCVFVREAT